jgi:hypothetical protein
MSGVSASIPGLIRSLRYCHSGGGRLVEHGLGVKGLGRHQRPENTSMGPLCRAEPATELDGR